MSFNLCYARYYDSDTESFKYYCNGVIAYSSEFMDEETVRQSLGLI